MSDERRQLILPEPERRLALVIGVDAAPSAQAARLREELNATHDAEVIAQVLTKCCGFELLTSSPLLGEAATSAQVKRAVLQLARERNEQDFLLLYFAGHGHLIEADGGRHDILLVTHDFNEREVKAGLHFSMRWLRDWLYLSPDAGKVLFILDCCYAGNMGRTAPDPYLEDLRNRINTYFGAPGTESGSRPRGLRQTLAATTHNQLAYEQNGYGRMTALLLDALRGQVDEVIDLANRGYITLLLVQNYLQQVMPLTQRSSLSGDDAGRLCILAQNEQRAEQLRAEKRATVNDRPQTYIPFQSNISFQQRPGEFDTITKHLLPGSTEHSPIVGLIGMGGAGKSQLAAELALLYVKEQRFPRGIFWLPVTEESEEALCYQ
ncbi:MAG TPA: caspase family protein, partial [Ktedonobacteraceae bacterium]